MATTDFTLPPDAGIRSIDRCTSELRDAMAPGRSVRVDLSSVAQPDLALIQLIAAARRDAIRDGTELTLATTLSPTLAALLDRAGFLTGSSDITAFWLHGDIPQ